MPIEFATQFGTPLPLPLHNRWLPQRVLLHASLSCALLSSAGSSCAETESPAPAPDAELAPITITAPRVLMVTPLPGVSIEKDQTTTNVQSATAEEIRASQSVTLTDVINGRLQSVTVNDYQGNPYQQDLVFRGFAASPLVGTPQGLSVYIDGVRVNEPFGEVVNWDLIPVNAIQRFDLMPGASPLFGLNTLGGALAISTKSGFTAPGVEGQITGGSWGRRQAQVAAGANDGTWAGFVALNRFDEEGWRDNSPSTVNQVFGRVDVKSGRRAAALSALYADNKLTGNGMVPIETYNERRETSFTAPDETRNSAIHLMGNVRQDFGEAMSIAAQAYHRKLTQRSVGGDFWDEFRTASSRLRLSCPDGVSVSDGAIGVDLPGCPNVMPNGLLNYGRSDQVADGGSLQWTWLSETHQMVVGATYDQNEVSFSQAQRLGFINDDRVIALTPERYDDLGLTALREEIQRNNLTGTSRSYSHFINDIWSVMPNLHLNFGARWTRTRVRNQLVSDRPIPLYQFDTNLARRQLPRCGAENGDAFARYYCSSGDYTYESLNPSFGVSWLPKESLNVYANFSKGSRTPSTIELGCARDRKAEELAGGGRNTGKTPGCSIPTALTSDPYLPQVVSYNYETGLRGLITPSLAWNASVFRTDLENDILFVSLGSRNRGVFDTFGKTRREGVEIGLEGTQGAHTVRASYSLMHATFESKAEVVNLSNSSSTKQTGRVNTFLIEPGDRIPGIPQHTFRLAWSYAFNQDFELGLSMIAHSWSYVRGNENNEHSPGGTDSTGASTLGTNDPSITVEPGRKYVGSGKIPGYSVFNLTTRYRLSPRWSLTARIDNLFDRRYFTAGELALNPFATSRWGVRDAAGFNYNSNDWTHSTFVGPGAPRAIWVGLAYQFDAKGGNK